MVLGPPRRQRSQGGVLLIDALGVGDVAAADDLVDGAPPGGEIVEIARPRSSRASSIPFLR
jgi:hypothetical protein